MSYTKYKTSGIVMGGVNIGEASRSFNIFTRDFGLVRVKAQGIRELKSKLKYNLQNLFLLEAHLVRGRYGWMITEAYKEKNLVEFLSRDKSKSLARVLYLAKRMLPEEERLEDIFDIIHGGFDFLETNDLSEEELKNLETLIILRFLRGLGYIKANKELDKFIEQTEFSKELLNEISLVRGILIKEINTSLKASGL